MNNKVQKWSALQCWPQSVQYYNLWHFRLCRRLVLKIDFSDIPILLGMFLYGPLAGVITAFVRSLLHLFLTGLAPQNMVGDFASFLASSIFTLPIFISLVKEKYPYKSDSGPSKWDLSLDDFHEYCELFCHYTSLLTIIWCDHTTIFRNIFSKLCGDWYCAIQPY